MTDIVGAVAYDVIAEFDATDFNENVAQGLARTRDEFGRFVKEHRTISQNMMKDLGAILGAGTSSAMSVVTKNMEKAADAAGKGFTARIGAALKSVPKSMGEALSSGAISTLSSAGQKLGQHISEAVAEQVRKSAPFWKKSFTESFNQAADVNTTTALGKLAEKIKGGGDNAGKTFQEALGDRFSKAGIVASSKLGNFAAQVANKLIPGSRNVGDQAADAVATPFSTKLKVGLAAAAGVGIIALLNRMRKGGRDAGDAGGNGIVAGVTASVGKLGSIIGSALRSAISGLASVGAAAGRAVAGAMGDALKLGANVAGGAVAGVLGTALAKGMGRLTAIDNAEASLRGLASTADRVPEIMGAVNNAVTGTAFGLDQGAKAAAQFAAAGVPIEDMERHLGSLANTAAAAGGDFDGIAGIFSKVAAGGKVTGDVLNQLTDRGLSALPALANELGTTAEGAREAVAEGAVSFDQFSRAMDAAMGQAAIEQATTFTGLMSNMGAGLGRLGAVAQKPFFDAMKTVLPGVINLLRQFQTVIEPLASIVAERLAPAAKTLGDALSALKFDAPAASANQLFGTLAALAPIVGGIAAAFAGPLLSSIPVVGSAFSGLTGPVGILLGALTALFAVKPETLMAGLETVTGALPGMLTGIVDGFANIVPGMVARFSENAPMLINAIVTILDQLVGTVTQLTPLLADAVIPMMRTLIGSILNALPEVLRAGIQIVAGLIEGIVGAIPDLISMIPPLIDNFITSLLGALPMIINAGIRIILSLVDGLVDAIPRLVRMVPMILQSLLDGITGSLPTIINAGIRLVEGLVEGVVQAVPAIIEAVVEAIPMILNALTSALPSLLEAGIKLIDGVIGGIIQALPQIIESVVGAIPQIITALMSALPQLIQGGIELVFGLITGIVQAIPQIIAAVVEAIPLLINGLVEALPLLIEGGIQLVLGLVEGIITAIPELIAAVIEAVPQIIGALIEAIPQLIEGGIKLVVGLIQGIINATPRIIESIKGLIPKILTALAEAFPQVVTFFSEAWTNITNTISDVWNGVVTFFTDTWNNILLGAQLQWETFTTWIGGMFNGIVQHAKDVWNGLISFFTGLWDGIKAVTQAVWQSVISWLSSVFQGAVNGAKDIWNGIKSFFSNLWTGIKKTFNTFLDFIRTKPKETFEKAVDAIGKAWDGLKKAAKVPVKFVVNTVVNGLIGTINKLPGVNIPKVKLPAGFARGGILPGQSRMSDGDDQLIMARRGEGMMVSEALRTPADRSAFLAANAAGRSGVGFSSMVPGFARGGLVNPLPKGSYSVSQPYHSGHNGIDLAAAAGTKIYAAGSGTVGLASSVPMGGNEVYIQHANGLGTRYSHMSRFATRAGSRVKAGNVIGYVGSTGMSTGPHLHYMVHKPGGGGGNYANHVNPAPYLGVQGRDLGESSVSGILGGLVDWAAGQIKERFPAGGMFVDAAAGVIKDGVTKLVNWGKKDVGEDTDDRGNTGRARLFDSGGLMPHGTTGVNLSGRTEAVLTNDQWSMLSTLASGLTGNGATGIAGQVTSGLAGGLVDEKSAVADAAKVLADTVLVTMRTELDIHSPSKKMQEIGKQIGAGLVKGVQGTKDEVQKTINALITSVKDEYKARGWNVNSSWLINWMRRQRTRLYDIANRQLAISEELESAQQLLEQRVNTRDSWVQQIRTGILDQGNISGSMSVGSMTRNLQRRIAATSEFNDAINELRKLGLDDLSIEQLASDFASSGSAKAAQRLAAGGADAVKEIANLQKQLNDEAKKVASGTGNMLYQSGIDAARGLVKGLESEQAALEAMAKKIADAITSQIKKTLKIKSPSRVMEDLGSDTGEGFVRGVESWIAPASAASTHLVTPRTRLTNTNGQGLYTGSTGDRGNQVVIEEGAIQVQDSADAAATSLELLDRMASELVGKLGG